MNDRTPLGTVEPARQSGTETIPRRIIQTGKKPELSLVCEAAVANVRLLNPGFEYRFFDDEAVVTFIEQEFPEYRDTFEEFTIPIQRFDFFRYLAVYRLGGFYLDLDVFLARSLEPLLHCACVFPFEELTLSDFLRKEHGFDWELANYAFGAEAGHPFIKAVIDNCIRGQRDPHWAARMMKGIPAPFRGQFLVPNTTGPGLVTRTFAERVDLRKTVTVLFPEDVCDRSNWGRFGQYGVHLMQGGWRGRDSLIRRGLLRIWMSWKRRSLLRASQRLGSTRVGDWVSHVS